MAENKKKNSGNKSYIFTRETIGMTIMLFSVVLLFILLTRDIVLSSFGAAICTLMYGAFGYGAYLVVAMLVYFGVWLFSEKKIKVRPGVALSVSALVISLFLLFHAVTTRNMTLASYGEYLNANYISAADGWSGYTFGGAVCGLIVFPVAKLTTFIGAYVIFSLLVLLCGYWAFRMLFKNKLRNKAATRTVVDVTEESYNDAQPAEPAYVSAADHVYTVNDSQEIVNNRVAEQYVEQPQPVQPNYVQQPQPAPHPLYANQPQALYSNQTQSVTNQSQPEQNEDKFSQRNLGRKILFEKGEFAAESYRRNMIFSDDSYFSRPANKEVDYLSSFSSGSAATQKSDGALTQKSEPQSQTYTQNYQEEVANRPATETPSNYVYGEMPVQSLDDNNSQAEDTYQSNEQSYPGYTESAAERYSQSIRQPEENARYEDRSSYFEQPAAVEEKTQIVEPPVHTEPEHTVIEEKPSEGMHTIFGGESVRGNEPVVGRRGEEQRGALREEASKQDIFDDDEVDLGEDRFGVSSRDTGFERSERSQRSETPAQQDKEVGFTMPPSERRATSESREVGFTAPAPERRVAPVVPPKVEQPKVEEKPVEKPKHVWKEYVRPSLDLLDDYSENGNVNVGEIEANKRIIVDILENFKIASEIANVTIAPAITRYDVTIFDKTKTRTALSYKDDIALALMKKNVTTYLNYVKGVISIEVPNTQRTTVGLKSMLASPQFINCKPNSLTFGLGKNIDGEVVCPDITKMPHLLVAGTTGSGKSICLSTLLISLLYKYSPEELRLILVDPKQAEFIPYSKIPHLMINEILYDVDKVIKTLNWAIKEMEHRYTLFKEMTERGTVTKTLDEYNAHLAEGEEKLPKILIVLDEFADLMMQAKKDIEGKIIRLAQKSRACGIHLILATQRPSVDCITGLIKSNLPTRIGFRVNSFADSSTIFDVGGAEKLLGMGDMYYRSAENPELTRIQGCFVSSQEVQNVTEFIKTHNETYFDEEATNFINKVEEPEPAAGGGDMAEEGGDTKIDETFIKALYFCVKSNMASVSMIQRRFPVGYIKACKIIDWMENMNYITPSEGSKPRKVLLSIDDFINTFGEVDD